MASIYLPSSSKSYKYDVFMSFRGEDTRYNFVSHLHAALSRKSIITFIDDELRRGEDISSGLLRKIEESKISVVIFSRNYASSTYCLDELEKIIVCHELCGQTVIPIFFHINPSDVLVPDSGIFAEALSRHEKDIVEKLNGVQGWKEWWKDSVTKAASFFMLHPQLKRSEASEEKLDKVRRWKVALTKAANLAGQDLHVIRSEAELVDKIVNDVWKRVKQVTASVSDFLVGIDSHIQHLQELSLVRFSDVRVLGIWGMAGIGKTTLAGAVFSQIAFQFEGCCFLSNIGKESEKSGGLTRLGEELLSKLLEEREVKLNTSDIKSSHFKNILQHRRVLIVLDDVNSMEQLEYFAGDICWFGPGSRIIITSRDKQLLRSNVDVIYEVKELNYNDALLLVCWYAFKQTRPLEDFVAQTLKVVRYARGNPLALKVLGSMLYGKSKTEWESALKKLKRGPHKGIQDVLKITYDNLDDEEQNIFLHIACLFEGEDKDRVVRTLDGCGLSTNIGISTLVDRSLLTLSKNKLEMHALVQEMGKEIVRQKSKRPSQRSRLWNYDDIHKVLRENTGGEAIEGILLYMSTERKLELGRNAFARFSDLKILIFRMLNVHSGFEVECRVQLPQGLQSLPEELRYLYWHGYPLKFLPEKFNPVNLVELNLPCSRLEGLWEDSKVPSSIRQVSKLTFMSLRYSKNIQIFQTTIELQFLETLDLSGCSNLRTFPEISGSLKYMYLKETAIQEVPLSVAQLSKLIILDMTGCSLLDSIPSTICKLKYLEIFILSGCKKLEIFPDILETMDRLEHLSLSETSMVSLPGTLCNLKALTMLNLSDCLKLKDLPENIKSLNLLEALKAGGCNLTKLPSDLKYLSSIVDLNLSGNNFDRLPAGFGQLSTLTLLSVTGCKDLQSIEELPPRIKYLNARDCRSLVSMSGLKQRFQQGCHSRLGDESFVFTNCYKLNQATWKDVAANAQVKIQHFAMEMEQYYHEAYYTASFCFTYPSAEIPEWFTYKSIGNSVTIQYLPSHWLNNSLLGFAVCLIVAFDDRLVCGFPRGSITCKGSFRNNYNGCSNHIYTLDCWKYFPAKSYGSKHVFMWYDCHWYDDIVAKMSFLKECRCNEISFEFTADLLDYSSDENNFQKVETCGVDLLYSKQ